MRLALIFSLVAALALAGCGTPGSASPSPTSTPNTTLAQNHVHSIAIMTHNPNVLYLGGHYRLYKSDDGGRTWHPLVKLMMLSIALDPTHPSTLYGVSLQRGLLRSTDGGVHWTSLPSSLPKGQITGVALDPTTGAILAYGSGIYRSVDGGRHWSRALPGHSITSVAAGSAGTLYAAAGDGLYVSHDGAHWTLVSSVGNQPVVQVVASGPIAYAAIPYGLFKTTNAGRSWKTLSHAPEGIEFLGMSPTSPNEVFAEVAQKGFVASHDGGTTWQPANNGIHDRNFSASTIRVAPSAPNVVYTGSWGVHFYASRDAGRHWKQVASLIR